jgi:hypothetical protein
VKVALTACLVAVVVGGGVASAATAKETALLRAEARELRDEGRGHLHDQGVDGSSISVAREVLHACGGEKPSSEAQPHVRGAVPKN